MIIKISSILLPGIYLMMTFSANGYAASLNKKALFIIPSKDFRDEEVIQPKDILEANGIKVTVASSTLKECTGMLGMKIKPDTIIDKVDVSDYDMAVFIGGGGASEYWNNRIAQKIAKDTVNSGKVLGAICIAPVILANAGVLKNKRATVWVSEQDLLEAKGAIYTGNAVEVDGNIITADGPHAAKAFAAALVKALSK